MPDELEPTLRTAAQSLGRPAPRVSPSLLGRMKVLAGLLREAPPAASGARLLWRDAHGDVRSLPVIRALAIGREPGCDIVLAGACVSRRHCVVRPEPGGDELEDLGSANGTTVNGERTGRRALRDGDVIEVGGAAIFYAR